MLSLHTLAGIGARQDGTIFAAVFTPKHRKLQKSHLKIKKVKIIFRNKIPKKRKRCPHTFPRDPPLYCPGSCRAPAPTKCVWRRSRSGEALSRPRVASLKRSRGGLMISCCSWRHFMGFIYGELWFIYGELWFIYGELWFIYG